MQTTLKFIKIRDVKTPVYGTDGSAGIDFFVPKDFDSVTLHPGESALIPSGIKAKVPDGYALIAHNKSGIATNKRLQVGACVVDSDYQGEIHLHVYNSTSDQYTGIMADMKLIQFLLIPVSHAALVECQSLEQVFPIESKRGEGGFGSTNKSDDNDEFKDAIEEAHR